MYDCCTKTVYMKHFSEFDTYTIHFCRRYISYFMLQKGYKSDETFRLAEEISDALNSLPNLLGEVVIDDRLKYSIGRRLYEAKRHGFPFVVILGRQV